MNLEVELDLTELKSEADSLGIKYKENIGAQTLKGKIDDFYAAQETSSKELMKAVKNKEELDTEVKQVDEKELGEKEKIRKAIAEAKAKAKATRIITIIDNDQRVNSQTTTCKVTCANMYFDLGSIILPLNMPVEVQQGHINVLTEVKIPLHIKNPQTGLSDVRMVSRYNIIYEDIKK
jgi:hypothetical protein